MELPCQWACTFFLPCLRPQCQVCWLLFPRSVCTGISQSIVASLLLLLAGVHTTSQLSRFHNVCRSCDECMLLSCYADKFTLFSLIPGTPRQCCQWTFISYAHALSPLQRVLGHFLRDPGPIDVIKWFCYFNLYYRYVQGRKPPRRGEDLKEVWLGLYCWNPSILTLFKAKCIKIATLFKR